MKNKPLISIVTVSYNAADSIEETILSVINQTYPNIEYIIIDGGSTDGTVDIIKKYKEKVSYWISEPDKGIYDAMNKGIQKATGKWINFMNCGDLFYDKTTLNIFNSNNFEHCDVIYGNRILTYNQISFFQNPNNLTSFKKDFPIFHQSTFVLTDLMKKEKFDCKYKICADYHFFFILWKEHKIFKYVDYIISICDCEYGISSLYKNDYIRLKENILIQNNGNKGFSFYLSLIKVYLKSHCKAIINAILPSIMKKYRLKILEQNLTKYEK